MMVTAACLVSLAIGAFGTWFVMTYAALARRLEDSRALSRAHDRFRRDRLQLTMIVDPSDAMKQLTRLERRIDMLIVVGDVHRAGVAAAIKNIEQEHLS